MVQSPVSKRSLALLGAAFMLTGCPDTQGRYDEFAERSEIYRTQENPDFGPAPAVDEGRQDLTGSYLFTLATALDVGTPLMFRADVTIDSSGDDWTFDLALIPLQTWCAGAACAVADPARWTPLEAAIIDAAVVTYVDDADGTFEIDLGNVGVPAEGNSISGSEITATLKLYGQTRGPDAFCGAIEGALITPFPFDLARDGNSFGAVRVMEGQALTDIVPVGACP